MSTTQVTVAGREVTRTRVLEVVAEANRVGLVRFLRQHGYKPGRYALRVEGRSYPSKAILGVAAGLASSEFFGGARGAAGSLARLGFEVREVKTGARISRELDSLRRQVARHPDFVTEPAWPTLPVDPSAYFASGTNRAPEISGAAAAGADIGVAAPEVSADAELELCALAGSDVQVFVDSGAFSEVKFSAAGREIVAPITDAEWGERLGLYKRLAAALGEQLFVVAPDSVGSQTETIVRLNRYKNELHEIAELGARILVPIQKGYLSQAEFAAKVDEVLIGLAWLPALPCKKAATTVEEAARFVQERRPRHIHLLGLGVRNSQAPAFLDACGRVCSVSLDSCWIGSAAGRKNGPGGGRRRLTIARDLATDVLARLGAKRPVRELAVYSVLAAGLVC